MAGPAVDVVIDPLVGAPAAAAATLLAVGGCLINIGASAGDSATFSSAALRSRSAEVLGYTNNSLSAEERNDALRAVLDHAGHGRLAVAHSTRELADVETAWREQSGRKSAGRVILTVT